MMRVLTVKQPWAGLLVDGVKTVENRGWRPGPSTLAAGDWLIIHAGKERGPAGPASRPPDPVRSALLGAVLIAGFTRSSTSVWADTGAWHWEVADARRLIVPVPHRGQLGLWRLDDDTAVHVAEMLQLPCQRPAR